MTTEKEGQEGQTAPEEAAPAKSPAKPRRSTAAAKGTGRRTTAKSSATAGGSGGSGRRKSAAAAETPVEEAAQPAALPRLLVRLREEIAPALVEEFAYSSPMAAPRLSKIVLNIGLGEALENSKALEAASNDLMMIAGQRPVTTRAKKSIAGFKIREGMAVGLMVTLRGRRMYEFFDRLVSSSLPRIRDFQGVSREAFDGRGNYSLGMREQVVFPEIDYNAIDRLRGLQVVITTTARSDHEGLRLLELMGMPFARIAAAA